MIERRLVHPLVAVLGRNYRHFQNGCRPFVWLFRGIGGPAKAQSIPEVG
jgi:hypothetical protein